MLKIRSSTENVNIIQIKMMCSVNKKFYRKKKKKTNMKNYEHLYVIS